MEIEGRIYGHLGRNKRIARCINWGDDFVGLRYECNSNLKTYLKNTHLINRAKYCIAQQTIEAVAFINRKDVIYSDLSARQFLVDRRCNVRLTDFGGLSLQYKHMMIVFQSHCQELSLNILLSQPPLNEGARNFPIALYCTRQRTIRHL